MNKVNILSIVFAGICAFSACTDDKDPVINDLKDSEGNNISFTLNAPNNSSYTLMPEKSVKEELNSRNSSRCRLPVPAKKS